LLASKSGERSARRSPAVPMSDISPMKHKFFRGVRHDMESRYELQNHLGRGAYGEVWAAKDPSANEEKVAIKKIHHCFSQATEAKRILRELRILRHVSHPNVIRIRDVLHPQSESSFTDLWVVFDFVDLDLRKLIASPQTISVAHVQWIAHQILTALRYLHSAHVLHRDLKPANVLLSGSCDVKICDFGLARVVDEEDWTINEARLSAPHPSVPLSRQGSLVGGACPKVTRQMTTHVVTRWYRAPELILLQRYTTAIDVWSFACILAELLTMLPEANLSPPERNALFPGRSCFPLSPTEDGMSSPANLDQLNVIFSVIGTPKGPFSWVERKEMREHLNALEPVEPTPLADLFPGSPQAAMDLLHGILQFEPGKRTSVADAVAHPFFEGMVMQAPQLVASKPVDTATIDFEHSEIKLPQVRRKILDEIRYYTQRRETTISPEEVGGGASSAQTTSTTVAPTPTNAADEEAREEGNRKRRRPPSGLAESSDASTATAHDNADSLESSSSQ